ncbi:MAG: hypothetical protein KDB01_24580 [Planctomycetaceae bacterium]|nr:hypothetical protein [Planctomycetaceae bacterium]
MYRGKFSHHSRFAMSVLCLSIAGLTGCEQNEKVIDIETPAGDIQVERSKDSGKLDVDVDVDHKRP